MKSLYIKNSLALMDFTSKYYDNDEELLSSEDFGIFLQAFINDLKETDHKLYEWLMTKSYAQGDAVMYIVQVLKYLTIVSFKETFDFDEIDRKNFLNLVERGYHYWRDMNRYSLIVSDYSKGLLLAKFISADGKFNSLILNFYRTVQEKLQGSRNNVYRQLQAGTNGSLFLSDCPNEIDEYYSDLKGIKFIQKVMLRSPIITYLKHNKRYGFFEETKVNPLSEKYDYTNFICFPIYVGHSLTFVYFHKDFMASAIGLTNLFEFASYENCKQKPDCIILFGVEDGKQDTTYFYDEEHDIYIGKLSYDPKIEYFGYFKKMALTLHNLAMLRKGYLPIHGAMIDFYLKDGTHKGVCLMGDSGTGKSETIEALNHIKSDIDYQELVFDDMGTMYINDQGEVVCIGTEIGAFVRLDDLDTSSAYKDLDRSIFYNPGSLNSRVITPSSNYDIITKEHKVDVFMYANNYSTEKGLHIIDDVEAAKAIYLEGKRYCLGTTSESGYSSTYFANPFGPMQEQELARPIIDRIFEALSKQGTTLGEIYTNLGLEDKGNGGINVAAKDLLDLIQ